MMDYAFFPGCTMMIRLPHIEKLSRKIFADLGHNLVDLDFSCCPTSRTTKDIDEYSWLVIAARNLAVAEEKKMPILTMCTGCTQTLVEAKQILEDKDTRKQVNAQLSKIGKTYNGDVEIKFFAQALFENQDAIRQKLKKKIELRIATHSGCHILRPSRLMQFDSAENPIKLDQLCQLLGAEPVCYGEKTLCCGYQVSSADKDASDNIIKDKLSSINDAGGADCLCVLCPTCMDYIDTKQRNMHGTLPIMHYLQLLGLGLGCSLDDIGYRFNKVKSNTIENLGNAK